jgi:hypothetical protein
MMSTISNAILFERGLCPRNRSWGEAARSEPQASDECRKGDVAPLRIS